MGAAIGSVLPLALGIAISPIPIIAAILMLLSPKARVTSVGFLLGWVAGIVVAVSVFTLLSAVLPEQDPDASRPIRGTVQLLLGVGLLLLAVGQWRRRPGAGRTASMPAWMKAIDTMRFPMALGLGFLLSAVNPKNLLMAAGAGVDIGAAGLDGGALVVVIGVFTLIAASTVLVPVVGYLVAAERLRGPLDALRAWLAQENAVIMAVLLLVIGVSMIGKGIAAF
ncbi:MULTISPECIES: GAP family protein [Microbacterium]|uniref:GAP family protein n=1 Tax=Microbacterium TaxID=33882 RepID=UPI00109C8AA0|nr:MULTISPECIES: GAP family protein [Microbacterium]MBN6190125.1 GAP family protein [Aneurinibacillus sp. BA2021]MCK2027028.1 GAP family protein [Microbacterium sufflavum]